MWSGTNEAIVNQFAFVCCARSNAAVLNIADALLKVSFTKFHILVSSEYHYDWHEDQYRHLSDQILETSRIDGSSVNNDVLVFICTIGSLSNPGVAQLFKRKRIKRLVIDEASQVPLSSYVFPLINFPTLKSIAFFGDPEQVSLTFSFFVRNNYLSSRHLGLNK